MNINEFKNDINKYINVWNYLSKFDFNHPVEFLYKENISEDFIDNKWNDYIKEGICDIDKEKLGLYIHIPFCTAICNYCHNNRDKWNKEDVDKYFKLLLNKIISKKDIFQWLKIKTIYFWWGTPSLLSWEQFEILILELKKIFIITKDTFINIETTPFSLDYDKIEILNKIGVNRISVWIQSTSSKVLWNVNRAWDYKFTLNTLNNIKKFKNLELNIDFIAWLPYEVEEDLDKNLLLIKEIQPDSLFIYKYKPHDKTPFFESWWRFLKEDFNKIELHHSLMTKKLLTIWYKSVDWNIECFTSSNKTLWNLHDFNYFNFQNSVISFWRYSEGHIYWKMFFRCTTFWDKSLYQWFESTIMDEKRRYIYNSVNLYWYIDINNYKELFSSNLESDFWDSLKILFLLKITKDKNSIIYFNFNSKRIKNMSLALFFDNEIINLIFEKMFSK